MVLEGAKNAIKQRKQGLQKNQVKKEENLKLPNIQVQRIDPDLERSASEPNLANNQASAGGVHNNLGGPHGVNPPDLQPDEF